MNTNNSDLITDNIFIKISKCKDLEIVKKVLSVPVIFKSTFGQKKQGEILLKTYSVYLQATKNDKVLGVMEISELTAVTAHVHIAILPEHRGEEAIEIGLGFLHYIKHVLPFRIVLGSFPEECENVKQFSLNLDFKQVGTIPNGIFYNGKYQSLILCSLDLETLL